MDNRTDEFATPVLLIFFARPDTFAKVFERVREARPPVLFLYQDGPRPDRPNDVVNIAKCREIAESVDWPCDVRRYYQETNVGCDPSGFLAHSWAFSQVNRCIVLEDDCLPDPSFFMFCQALLVRYENDTRINMICGTNQLGIWKDAPEDYFFSRVGGIWGWASWSRVVSHWDTSHRFLDDPRALQLLERDNSGFGYKWLLEISRRHRASGKAHFESLDRASIALNSTFNIVPTRNLISNIGIGGETSHGTDSLNKLANAKKGLFFSKTYSAPQPLTHPQWIIPDKAYDDAVLRILAVGHPVLNFFRSSEELLKQGWFYLKEHGFAQTVRRFIDLKILRKPPN